MGNPREQAAILSALKTDLVDLVFSLDTSAYASGDVLASTQELPLAVRKAGGQAVLDSLTLVDKDDQKVKLYVVILGANFDLGAENGAPDLTDTEALDVLGVVTVLTTDYVDLGGASVATIRNIGLVVEAAAGSRSLYVAILNDTGTPTYSAAGLKGRFGFRGN